jgi:serine/threonine protein kinase
MRKESDQLLRIMEADPPELPTLAPIESVGMNDAAIRADWVGRTVDRRFALLEWLGGSAKRGVFLTVRQGLQRAAIKLFVAAGVDADAYLAQWELAKGISHPHLMPVFEIGRYAIDGTEMVYIVTEHADSDLGQAVRNGAFDAHAARDTFNPILDAVSCLHEKGVVHGRIKPSNVFRVAGNVMLSTDEFLLAGEVAKTQPMRSVYDAPEIASGHLTPAADIWSLGMTLAEALTRQLPLVDQEPNAEPVLPDSLPKPFCSLIQDSLRVDPAARSIISDFRAQLAFATALLAANSPVAKPKTSPATEKALADPIPALPEPELFAEPASRSSRYSPSLSFDPGVKESFQPSAASTLFSAHDEDEPRQGRIPFVPIFLGFVVLAAFVLVLLVRSNRLKLSWPLTSPGNAVSSQSAPSPQTQTPPANSPPTEPAASSTAQPQSSEPAAATQPPPPDQGAATQPPAVQPSGAQAPATNESTAQSQPQAAPPATDQVAPPERQPARAANAEGTVADRVMPNVSPNARVSMHGPVEVTIRVTVDRSGKVEDASFVSPGPGNYFARVSQRAAQGWTFDPPRRQGRSEPSVWILRFYFSHRDTEVSAIEESR